MAVKRATGKVGKEHWQAFYDSSSFSAGKSELVPLGSVFGCLAAFSSQAAGCPAGSVLLSSHPKTLLFPLSTFFPMLLVPAKVFAEGDSWEGNRPALTYNQEGLAVFSREQPLKDWVVSHPSKGV